MDKEKFLWVIENTHITHIETLNTPEGTAFRVQFWQEDPNEIEVEYFIL